MSDGSIIRVLTRFDDNNDLQIDRQTLVFIGGWSTPVEAWDDLLFSAYQDFDIVVFESREKASSTLIKNSIHDLSRVSLDLQETLKILDLDKKPIILLSSSWGTILVAHALSLHLCNPMLSVYLGPIARLTFPEIFRSILPRLPHFLLNLMKPLAYSWIFFANHCNWVQARGAIGVLANADFKKWTAIGQHVNTGEYWELFESASVPSLVIYSENDKFHDLKETERIISLIPDVRAVHVDTIQELMSKKVISIIKRELKRTVHL